MPSFHSQRISQCKVDSGISVILVTWMQMAHGPHLLKVCFIILDVKFTVKVILYIIPLIQQHFPFVSIWLFQHYLLFSLFFPDRLQIHFCYYVQVLDITPLFCFLWIILIIKHILRTYAVAQRARNLRKHHGSYYEKTQT